MRQHFELSTTDRDALYGSILEASHPDVEYFIMLALSGLIALAGLLQNRAAVIDLTDLTDFLYQCE